MTLCPHDIRACMCRRGYHCTWHSAVVLHAIPRRSISGWDQSKCLFCVCVGELLLSRLWHVHLCCWHRRRYRCACIHVGEVALYLLNEQKLNQKEIWDVHDTFPDLTCFGMSGVASAFREFKRLILLVVFFPSKNQLAIYELRSNTQSCYSTSLVK